MKTIQLEIQNNLAVITLNRGRSNPINLEMVEELSGAIESLNNNDDALGLIISGKEGFFSAGVDLIEAYNYNEQQSRLFWESFLQLQYTFCAFKKPAIAAISGHSPAGGCILALCCDYRIMAKGNFMIGLNEVPVGIIVPDAVFHLYSFWLGRHKAYQYLLEGRLLSVEEALQNNLIDEAVEPENLLSAAQLQARKYMSYPNAVWQQSKLNFRKELIAKLQHQQADVLEEMLQQWWSPDTRKALQKVIESFKPQNIKKQQ
ncbi:enoyl-CoA hydratase/isomerase family protein [Mucilaginibacter sp. RS28]|uniref:Enoyl-CoA hydratase/isomerase family protein n=1 Tax=Mucilaginibacter straminoryzae TaxID=2932774 RepID=A0A9X2B858_9SPHI|nr:enoyl-CoA hydratase/isomerase family protein [Mucilaginibacter straminoryzae]MCJ8209116.1 enoyl-CoA hydratase/isomerase family protein [Mucilaginibacter straminoryzae]